MALRFYVDADLIALGKSLVAARYDVTFPGDPGDPRRGRQASPILDPATEDPVWIPIVARLGLVVISRDRAISRRTAELEAVRRHALRLVVLDTSRDPSTWEELRIVTAQWDNIEQLWASGGPAIRIASRTAFRKMALP